MTFENNEICLNLWSTYESNIRRIATYKLRSCPDEIDDIVSETFLALCEKMENDGIPDKPKEWLYGTLSNIINQKYREVYRAKERNIAISDKQITLPYETDFVSDTIEKIYTKELLSFINSQLSKEEKELIDYIYKQNLKMKQIAKIKNTTEAAIKQKHYRLCNRLKKLANDFDK